MTILGIETSTKVCSAALVKDGETLRQEISLDSGNHAGLLPVYIEQLLAYAREQGIKIDAVALSEGPGSYTGLRIGLSTAKGLCYGLDVPLIAVPTTEVMCGAASAQIKNLKLKIQNSILCPMIDARRMEVYTALYRYDGEKLEQLTQIESRIIADGTWPTAEEGTEIYYFGDGAEKCRELLENDQRHYIAGIVPEAQYITVSGEGLTVSGTEIAYYEPFYLKEFQAAPAHVKGLK